MKQHTRRHFLTGCSLGLLGLAGCVGDPRYTIGDNEPTPRVTPPPLKDTEPDGNYWEDTTTHIIQLDSTAKSTYDDLPRLLDTPQRLLTIHNYRQYLDNFPHNTNDGRITIESDSTASGYIYNAQITDPITVSLHIRDTNNTFHRKTTTLTPETTDTYTTHSVTFDISDVSLPTQAGGYAMLCVNDPDAADPEDCFLTHHQFVRIPYKNGLKYVNERRFAAEFYVDSPRLRRYTPKGTTLNGRLVEPNGTPAGAVLTEDDANGRTVFLVARNTETNELMGASCYIKHDPIERWENGEDYEVRDGYRYNHSFVYEAQNATKLQFLNELAQSTHDAITKLGLPTQYEKLSALADFVQILPYNQDYQNTPPSAVLYKATGDCQTKSHVYGCLLQNDPWNVKHAYVKCELLNLGGHEVVGIESTELDGMPPEIRDSTNFYKFPKKDRRNGFPNDEYALVEITSDSKIGDDRNLTDIKVKYLADYSGRNYGISTRTPDY